MVLGFDHRRDIQSNLLFDVEVHLAFWAEGVRPALHPYHEYDQPLPVSREGQREKKSSSLSE